MRDVPVTVLYVAANGGHLAELVALAPRLRTSSDQEVWATPTDAQSRSLLAGREHVVLPPVRERAVVSIARLNFLAASVFRSVRPRAVISTGSGVALAFLPQAASRGIPAYFIESAAFAHRTSVTGRVLERLPGIRCFTQYPARESRRWRYGGSVFDGCTILPSADPVPVRRVVVSLGSDRWTFRPLVEEVASVLGHLRASGTEVEARWQVGPTDVRGLGIEAVDYLPASELAAWFRWADVVVSHAGAGGALTALRSGRQPVLIPRDPARGEVIDDHQLHFARALDARGLAIGREVGALGAEDLLAAAGARVLWAAAPSFALDGKRQ